MVCQGGREGCEGSSDSLREVSPPLGWCILPSEKIGDQHSQKRWARVVEAFSKRPLSRAMAGPSASPDTFCPTAATLPVLSAVRKAGQSAIPVLRHAYQVSCLYFSRVCVNSWLCLCRRWKCASSCSLQRMFIMIIIEWDQSLKSSQISSYLCSCLRPPEDPAIPATTARLLDSPSISSAWSRALRSIFSNLSKASGVASARTLKCSGLSRCRRRPRRESQTRWFSWVLESSAWMMSSNRRVVCRQRSATSGLGLSGSLCGPLAYFDLVYVLTNSPNDFPDYSKMILIRRCMAPIQSLALSLDCFPYFIQMQTSSNILRSYLVALLSLLQTSITRFPSYSFMNRLCSLLALRRQSQILLNEVQSEEPTLDPLRNFLPLSSMYRRSTPILAPRAPSAHKSRTSSKYCTAKVRQRMMYFLALLSLQNSRSLVKAATISRTKVQRRFKQRIIRVKRCPSKTESFQSQDSASINSQKPSSTLPFTFAAAGPSQSDSYFRPSRSAAFSIRKVVRKCCSIFLQEVGFSGEPNFLPCRRQWLVSRRRSMQLLSSILVNSLLSLATAQLSALRKQRFSAPCIGSPNRSLPQFSNSFQP